MGRGSSTPTGPLAELLARDPLRRRAAVRRMAGSRDEVREPLMAALADSDETVRAGAAEALAAIGDAGAAEALTWALADPSPPVRAASASALRALEVPLPVARLIDLLRDDSSIVRHAAARALGQSGEPSVARELLLAIKTSPGISELVAAPALVELGSDAVDALIEALDDVDERVQEAAIRALDAIADLRAVEPISRLAHHENERTRFLASQAVRRMTSSETM